MEKRYLVYFSKTEDNQFVKVGHCQGNLYDRGQKIQNGCPIRLCEYPAGVIICQDKDDMLKVEKATQKQFKAYRTQGEWFTLAPKISEHIEGFTDTESGKAFVDESREAKNKRQNERKWERYQNDPEFRERKKKYLREYHQHKKAERLAESVTAVWIENTAFFTFGYPILTISVVVSFLSCRMERSYPRSANSKNSVSSAIVLSSEPMSLNASDVFGVL